MRVQATRGHVGGTDVCGLGTIFTTEMNRLGMKEATGERNDSNSQILPRSSCEVDESFDVSAVRTPLVARASLLGTLAP